MIAKIVNISCIVILLISTVIFGIGYFKNKNTVNTSKATLNQLRENIDRTRNTIATIEYENEQLRDLNERTSKKIKELESINEQLKDTIARRKVFSGEAGKAIDRAIEIISSMEDD